MGTTHFGWPTALLTDAADIEGTGGPKSLGQAIDTTLDSVLKTWKPLGAPDFGYVDSANLSIVLGPLGAIASPSSIYALRYVAGVLEGSTGRTVKFQSQVTAIVNAVKPYTTTGSKSILIGMGDATDAYGASGAGSTISVGGGPDAARRCVLADSTTLASHVYTVFTSTWTPTDGGVYAPAVFASAGFQTGSRVDIRHQLFYQVA